MSCPPVSCLLPAVPTKDVIITLRFVYVLRGRNVLRMLPLPGLHAILSPQLDIIITLRHPPTLNSANFKLSKTPAKHFYFISPSLSLCQQVHLQFSIFSCQGTLLKTLMYIFISVKWFVRIRDTVLNLRKMEARKCNYMFCLHSDIVFIR